MFSTRRAGRFNMNIALGKGYFNTVLPQSLEKGTQWFASSIPVAVFQKVRLFALTAPHPYAPRQGICRFCQSKQQQPAAVLQPVQVVRMFGPQQCL